MSEGPVRMELTMASTISVSKVLSMFSTSIVTFPFLVVVVELMVVMVTLQYFSSSWRMLTNSSEIKSVSDPPSRSASTVVDFPFFGFFTRTGAMERMTLSEASTLLPVDAAASQEDLAGFSAACMKLAASIGSVEGSGTCGVWVAAAGAVTVLAYCRGFVRRFGVCP